MPFLLAIALQVPGAQWGVETTLDTPQLMTAELHVDAAQAALEAFPGYANLCNLNARIRNVNVPRLIKPKQLTADVKIGNTQPSRKAKPEHKLSAKLPATRVFDNLYFFGTRAVGAWLYGTEDGYILIDGLNTDEEAKKYILGGMRHFGLNPYAITHILVTHGHGDHYGGADYIAKMLGIDVFMSEADWKLVSLIGTHPRFGPPPRKGEDVQDGQIIHTGGSELQVFITPGHTPGTISPVFEVYDRGQKHTAMLWGGTGFNFGSKVSSFLTYAESASRMRGVAQQLGIDVYLSGHPRRDGSDKAIESLAQRAAGQVHPFVQGDKGLLLFTLLEQCALAQAARFTQ